MAPVDRLGRALRTAREEHRALLVVYLTHAPASCSPVDLARAAVEAGADVLELGIPTPSTRPRGEEVGASFRRAAGTAPERSWETLRRLREALPHTPLLPLVYPETSGDLGWDALLGEATAAGADGLVLTRPWHDDGLERVAAAGVSAVPVLPATADPDEVARAEEAAAHLTYRALSDRTGGRLDPRAARRRARELARGASAPFLVGFGVSTPRDVAALAPHAAGVVVGSEAIRVLRTASPRTREQELRAAVRAWREATHRPPADPPVKER
ncbi:hypothetical protein F0L17_26120 [Streptomyces sp. TRM43335]|uniref:tryptophan synthase n=1 Tax=Streptomyces taklimakanensis TaxID=2569853 RepID=A0A6G2BKA6_9ACTN|nr:tryptophan synthase subunit alpha [Streptomyces taklimakanensis]MTE22509.1 hypothetical protein [Streptomyces taklimakanensis]